MKHFSDFGAKKIERNLVRNTRRITFVLQTNTHTMILTATFHDCKTEKTIGKRGGIKWNTVWVEVVDELHPVVIKFGGKAYTLYTRGKDKDANLKTLYYADGSYAKGNWRHGRYGSKIHEEPIHVWASGKLMEVASYASGQIKDQHKYLLGIIEKTL